MIVLRGKRRGKSQRIAVLSYFQIWGCGMMTPGRPLLTQLTIPIPRAEVIIHDITFFVDRVMSWLYSLRVPTFFDVKARMKERVVADSKRLQAIREEMTSLSAAYNRFVDLREEQLAREKRIQRLIAILGPEEYADLSKRDPAPDYPLASCFTAAPDVLRQELPLWIAMQEYLGYVAEARIAEIESFFGMFGVEMLTVNRQAIESALKRHPDVFKTKKRKREKFISLRRREQE